MQIQNIYASDAVRCWPSSEEWYEPVGCMEAFRGSKNNPRRPLQWKDWYGCNFLWTTININEHRRGPPQKECHRHGKSVILSDKDVASVGSKAHPGQRWAIQSIQGQFARCVLGFVFSSHWMKMFERLHFVNSRNICLRHVGILSPLLFNVYIDNLGVCLTNLRIGCNFHEVYVNHIIYSDDAVLLAPSPSALQELIDYCTKFAAKNDIFYNLKKSKCMCIRPRARRICIFLWYI